MLDSIFQVVFCGKFPTSSLFSYFIFVELCCKLSRDYSIKITAFNFQAAGFFFLSLTNDVISRKYHWMLTIWSILYFSLLVKIIRPQNLSHKVNRIS